MAIRVLLADDHRITRDGLRGLLEMQEEIEVVGEAGTGREAVEQARQRRPDVVVMDVSMPDLNGVEATRQITAADRPPKVIALSMHEDRRSVARMLRAGAAGYLLKDTAFEEVIRAIQEVADDGTYLSPRIAGAVVDDYIHNLKPETPLAESILTDREREVLQLIAEGLSTKQIAARLHVSVKTVGTHRMHLMEKLNVHSIAGLTKYAIREGLTPL